MKKEEKKKQKGNKTYFIVKLQKPLMPACA